MNQNTIVLRKSILKKGILIVFLTMALIVLFVYSPKEGVDLSAFKAKVNSADYTPPYETPKGTIYLEVNEGSYEFVNEKITNVYSYNNQIPGPLIKGILGKNQTVRVKNNLKEPTTIHWHGLQLANIEDGVPEVTQEPIHPGESFEYELEFRNSGLYWYHSHVDADKQVESGLQGPIVVKGQDGLPDGNILVLDDVLLGTDYEFRSFDLGVMHGRFGNVILVNGKVNPRIDLENNRLRIVNTANARTFNLQFNGKAFTVIGMDIGSSEHYNTTLLTISPGERYDILLPKDVEDEIIMSYYTRNGNVPIATLLNNKEHLSPLEFESFIVPFDMDEMIKKEPSYTAELEGYRGGKHGLIWSINRKYYPDNPETFSLKEGDTVKLRIKNTQGQPHPMHLHGQKFIVLTRDGLPVENLGWKDTVMVGGYEEVDIVFIAEEKGTWVFHCHILEHAEAGMLSLVTVT